MAFVLAAGWLELWILYLSYSWTVPQLGGPGAGAVTLHVIRFYLPALGPIALLATWLLTRLLRRVSWTIIAALLVAGLFSFHAMAASPAPGQHRPGAPPPGGAGPGNVAPYGPGP
jgi:hypothetical protein